MQHNTLYQQVWSINHGGLHVMAGDFDALLESWMYLNLERWSSWSRLTFTPDPGARVMGQCTRRGIPSFWSGAYLTFWISGPWGKHWHLPRIFKCTLYVPGWWSRPNASLITWPVTRSRSIRHESGPVAEKPPLKGLKIAIILELHWSRQCSNLKCIVQWDSRKWVLYWMESSHWVASSNRS